MIPGPSGPPLDPSATLPPQPPDIAENGVDLRTPAPRYRKTAKMKLTSTLRNEILGPKRSTFFTRPPGVHA